MAVKSKKSEYILDQNEGEKKIISSQDVLDKLLKEEKAFHYNFEEAVTYKVSSGSLVLDSYTGGGIGPGLHRFTGLNEGGKTSQALAFMYYFLQRPNAKGFYIKAEGRLSEDMIRRSGINFVYSSKDWVDGTCFVFESNIYETAVDAMRKLVQFNDEKKNYFFILDSVDGLISKGDLDRTFEESNKVAGGAVIAANFMKRMSIALAKRGHMAIFISQVRADIKLDPYSKEPIRQTTATGGNALLHFANWILEFNPRFRQDLIIQNPDIKEIDPVKNPIVGHFAKVTVKKSPNEKTNLTIAYPIKYGKVGGPSVWVEKEVVDLLLSWGLIERGKSGWMTCSEDLVNMIQEAGLPEIPKIQGMDNLFKFLESNQDIMQFLINYFKEHIGNEI